MIIGIRSVDNIKQLYHQDFILVLTAICMRIYIALACYGNVEFRSEHYVQHNRQGDFASPNWPHRYPGGSRCKYIFVAKDNEKVVIKFQHFDVEGLSSSCMKDFVDVYIKMQSEFHAKNPDKAELHGRYCGHQLSNVPNIIISLHHIVVIDFFSTINTQRNYNTEKHAVNLGFNGTFEFLSDKRYKFGAPYLLNNNFTDNNDGCSFKIDGNIQTSGTIMSPTYPGIYPNNINCTIVFVGKASQRVRLIFQDFDLYDRANSCPTDYIVVYDSLQAHPGTRIGDLLCGNNHSNLILFSTTSFMRLEFITTETIILSDVTRSYLGDHSIPQQRIQNRGFNAVFTFSTDFVNIKDDSNLDLYHIKGTECDFVYRSLGTSNGVLFSPNYPSSMPENKVCTYYLFGIDHRQKRERIEMHFDYFSMSNYSAQGACRNEYLAIFLHYDESHVIKPSQMLCGSVVPASIDSQRESQLILVLKTAAQSNKYLQTGFKSRFEFHVDYGINGVMLKSNACHFVYNSSLFPQGVINSPFYPQHYPLNIECTYQFHINESENIRLTFQRFLTEDFYMSQTLKKVHHSSGVENCTKDYLEISEVILHHLTAQRHEKQLVRYCGIILPGPWIPEHDTSALVLRFISDADRTSTGFSATFEYFPKIERFTTCGANVSSVEGGGIIQSPNSPLHYPSNVNCEWQIFKRSSDNDLILQFADFELEGSSSDCSNAVLRIYEADDIIPKSEICGTDSAIQAFVTSAPFIRLRFLSTAKSNGVKGFRITWTEVIVIREGEHCPGFRCQFSKYCIDRRLECNDHPNCGSFLVDDNGRKYYQRDVSDETTNCPISTTYNLLYVGIGILLTVMFLILIVISILYKEHNRSKCKLRASTCTAGNSAMHQPLFCDNLYNNQIAKHSVVSHNHNNNNSNKGMVTSLTITQQPQHTTSLLYPSNHQKQQLLPTNVFSLTTIRNNGSHNIDYIIDAQEHAEKMQKISIV